MKIGIKLWSKLGITGKFSLAFTLMLTFIVLIATTSYFSLYYIEKTEEKILQNSRAGQLVLEMDRGLEKARRLHGNFFIQYPHIGLQAAHEAYAQPSVREIARVIAQSKELKQLLFASTPGNTAEINRADINLYLSSAERFAETSIEAVELITSRAAPKWGLEALLKSFFLTMEKELYPYPKLWSLQNQASSFYKDYLVSRQRFLMQSTLNLLTDLSGAADSSPAMAEESLHYLQNLITSSKLTIGKLLEVDLEISAKLRDFSLQEQAVSPLSKKLIQRTQNEVKQAGEQISHVHLLTTVVMFTTTLLAIFAVLYIARLMHESVTKNVLKLSAAAEEFSKDNLEIRVRTTSRDELGQLGNIFNQMAARLKDLIENLEEKVRQRTAELSESEQRFRHLVNDLPKIAVQGYDSERRVIYWNKASETLYGYTQEEAMGRHLEDLIILEPMRDEIITRFKDWLEKDMAIGAKEMVMKNKDGSEVPVYTSHVMLTSYQGDKTTYSVDIDLAELKLAQEKGEKSEFFYRQLFMHSSSGVAVYEAIDDGRDFIFRDINRAGEAIDQVNREDILGKSVSQLFPGIKEIGLLKLFRRVWLTGDPEYHPATFYKDERFEGWRENRVYKLPSGEIVAVYDDTTPQKQAEDEKQAMALQLQRAQKMEAIGLLAGGVAHDLNNILSAVVGYPELLLLELPSDSKLRRPLEATKEAGERATAVVADLLTVARGVASAKEPHNLNLLIQEYLDSPEFYKLQSQHPEVRFKHTLATNLPPILCSAVHVKKSIMNLVINGSEAIEGKGTITLANRLQRPEQKWIKEYGLEQKNYVVLSISDTGSGISEKDLEHIFEPFYTKKVMGASSGTGLGLSIVWNTMRDHQGAVIVSRHGDCTVFDLYFPTTEKTLPVTSEQSPEIDLQGQGEKILVVDDEPQQRDLARDMLKLLGYSVDCCESGKSALAYMENHKPDLVLLDMLMDPGINGRVTYERMLNISPGQKAIIASGFSESDDVKVALHLGAGGFIQKPYSIEQLGRAIKTGLQKEVLH